VMMENCCYDRRDMLALMLVRKGMLGELLHAECGYLHDLRGIKFSKEGEGLWRRAHAVKRNGNLYPTHGLGPVAQCFDINRGNQFEYLVSMSSPSRGLRLWNDEKLPADDPRKKEVYKLGDVNVSLIKTVKGQTIYLINNTDDPRPYSRINEVQGTKGLLSGWPDRIHIEGRSPNDEWETLDKYYEEYEHPLWKSEKAKKATRGHGGMDFLEDYRFIECLRAGVPADMNVYDAAALSVVCDLTERSVADRSRPQDFPDFTRGKWKTTAPDARSFSTAAGTALTGTSPTSATGSSRAGSSAPIADAGTSSGPRSRANQASRCSACLATASGRLMKLGGSRDASSTSPENSVGTSVDTKLNLMDASRSGQPRPLCRFSPTYPGGRQRCPTTAASARCPTSGTLSSGDPTAACTPRS